MSEQPVRALNGKRARIIDAVLMIVLVLGGLWLVFGRGSGSVSELVGAPAPAFKLRTVAGEVVGPSTYEGRVVLLDFWATWCNPCLRQMPAIEQVAHEHPDDLVVLAVNVDVESDGRRAAMARFLEQAGLELDSLLDDGAVQSMYGVTSIPTLVVIDREGTVTYASSGIHTFNQLDARIRAVLEK